MKTTQYQTISILLILALTLSILAGCASGNTGDKGEATPSASAEAPAQTQSPKPQPTPTPSPTVEITPSPTPYEEEIHDVTDIANGDVTRVQFGQYVWRVLTVEDGKALITTEDIIERRVFNEVWKTITWEKCDIRKYLNGEFYNTFSDDEKKMILETKNENADNPWFGTSAGNATKDKIFLLSVDEVIAYFGDSGLLAGGNSDDTVGKIDDQYNNARMATFTDGSAAYWWLRTFGDGGTVVAVVASDGVLVLHGAIFAADTGGVRPALWLDLE